MTDASSQLQFLSDTGEGVKPGGFVDHPVAATTVIAEGRSAAPFCATVTGTVTSRVGLSEGGFVNRNLLLAVASIALLLIGCARQPVLPSSTQGGPFDLQVVYPGNEIRAGERQAFDEAARRWSQVVVGDLSDSFVEQRHVEQYCEGYGYSGPIDDLLLIADVTELDGPGGIVGMAGACIVRSDGFPLVGLVVIDRYDIDQLTSTGDLYTVVLHEMGHVLDISHSGWQRRGLLSHDREKCLESRTVRFTGSTAMEEYGRLGGTGGEVPVEDNAVVGTACSHWDHETFHSELMTGYLSHDARLSRLTIGALADMGYQVDMSAADEYSLDDDAVRPQSLALPVDERLLQPAAAVDEEGEIVPLPDQTGGTR